MRNLFNDSVLMQTLHPSETNDVLLVIKDLLLAHATYISSEQEVIALAGQLHLKLHSAGKKLKSGLYPNLVTLLDDIARVNLEVEDTRKELLEHFRLSSTYGPVMLSALGEFGYVIAAIYNGIFDTDTFLEDGYIDLGNFQVSLDEDKFQSVVRSYPDGILVDDILTTPPLCCTVKEVNYFSYSVAVRQFD